MSHSTLFMKKFKVLYLLACCMTLGIVAGCDTDSGPPPLNEAGPLETRRPNAIAQAYYTYVVKNKVSPKTVDELKSIIKEKEYIKEEDPEQTLVSPRDNEKYVIIYNAPLTGPNDLVIAYEKKGTPESRYVCHLNGRFRPVTPEEFKSLSFPPGHKPQ